MGRFARHAVALLLGAVWLAACSGSITSPVDESVIEGQVRIVTDALAPSVASSIEISVAGTSVATRVAADGSFELAGVPAGDVDLVVSGPWGESSMRLDAVARGQTVRVAVAVTAAGAAIETVSRSSNDLILSVLPDRWQLSWLEPGRDDLVVAMITGDETFLESLDGGCFQLVGDRAGAEPLLPDEVLFGTESVALRFAGADTLGLLDEPFAGGQHDVEVGFCFTITDDDLAEPDTLTADGFFLLATITVADDLLVPDATPFTAAFDPEVIPLDPSAEATTRLVVRGDEADLGKVAGGQLRLVVGEASGAAFASSDAVEPDGGSEDGIGDGVDATGVVVDVTFDRNLEGEDGPVLEALVTQTTLLDVVGGEPGTYDLTLTLTLEATGDEVSTTADASFDVPVTLIVVGDGNGEDDSMADGLAADLQPAAWNTNWQRNGAGWVSVKIVGTGYADVDLDVIALSASMDATDESGVLERQRVQRQGNHVRAFFRQRDAIALLDDPVPGGVYDLWVHVGEGPALPVTVTVTGPQP